MNRNKKLQAGGVIDEDDLFQDDSIGDDGQAAKGLLDGELVGDPPEITDLGQQSAAFDATQGDADDADEDADANNVNLELTGVEQFLTNYGVQGGIITYEDGTKARFSELEPEEQNTILSSLISESVPTIEQKYNLDDDEIGLINSMRESEQSTEEFINSIVDYRLQQLMDQKNMSTTDYTRVSDDAIFVKHLQDSFPDLDDTQIAEELLKAKDMTSYTRTVDTMRKSFAQEQKAENERIYAEENKAFNEQLEAQRYDVVQTVEGINDIAGATITREMKEFLLHDIMELNGNKDPILMEKLFSSPETMFKANWFANYGESYIQELNNYWKKEVSKAHKTAYAQAVGGMPQNPTIISSNGKAKPGKSGNGQMTVAFGKELTEEELFEGE